MKGTKQRPNVVIVLTDDQGYGDFGCHGNGTIFTPNIDKLYEESVHLTDFHMAPTCAPARAGLMTGRYNDRSCVWHTIGGRSILHRDETTMGEIFQDAGYRTACFGKWHLGDNYPYRAHDRGFDEVVIHRGGGIGQSPDYWNNDYFSNVFDNKGVAQKYKGYCTDVFFDLTIDFIRRNRENPFLVYLAPNAPHYPLRVESKYENLYKGKMPENRARCYGMLTNIDDNVAKLRNAMEDLGVSDDTIFIYASDNGGEFGLTMGENQFVAEGHNGGMRGMKCSAYEGGHRVPCFIHYPEGGLTDKRDITECTANMDLLPTLMELCGVKNKRGVSFDGKSILPLLKGETSGWPSRALIVDSQRVAQPVKWKTSCVMYDKWRLIDGRELYDLTSDFEQKRDVSEKHPALVGQLRQEYEAWWADVSRRFNEPVSISIGSPRENPVYLSSHDWRGSEPESVWNQGEIRRGVYRNSYLEIKVEREGKYRFSLCRWPQESGLRIREGIEGDMSDVNDWYTGGRALDIVRAKISVAGQEQERTVSEADKAAVFELILPQGETTLQTWFFDREEKSLGAYCVYAEYIGA